MDPNMQGAPLPGQAMQAPMQPQGMPPSGYAQPYPQQFPQGQAFQATMQQMQPGMPMAPQPGMQPMPGQPLTTQSPLGMPPGMPMMQPGQPMMQAQPGMQPMQAASAA